MEWIIKEPILPKVGTKEHRDFKQFLWDVHGHSTRMKITTLRKKYLIEYWNQFKQLQNEYNNDSTRTN